MSLLPSMDHEEQSLPAQDAKADLRSLMAEYALPKVDSVRTLSRSISSQETTTTALAVLKQFNAALEANDVEELGDCFFTKQAFWKDQLALTWHLRTFISPAKISKALLETSKLRSMTDGFIMEGGARFVQAGPSLQFIVFTFGFKTNSPAATCSGTMWLLPVESHASGNDTLISTWKIWIMSTKLEELDQHPEDESLLRAASTSSSGLEDIKTDVFIVGGGNAAMALAARLKALGVHSVMADRNASVGDNWALRYDCMKFHVPTSFCELPYLGYPSELQDRLLTKTDLSAHIKRYARTFDLDYIGSVKIIQTTLNKGGEWHIKFQTPSGMSTATARHLVQATGIGSQKPYLPPMTNEHAYRGLSMHSSHYENAQKLKAQGIKTVCIIGSANTAFDVLEECHAAGLQPTMISRSPTYIVPLEYVCDAQSLGAYDYGVEAADRMFMMLPTIVDAQLGRGLFSQLASEEPDRYSALRELGFPVLDSSHPDTALMHNLVERGGGHYVDTGATALLTQKKVGLVVGVEPKAYTPNGLQLSDGTTLEAGAVIWCTGFADKDVRQTVADTLKISLPLDPTWGVNGEGEIRGVWRRHTYVDNYWVMGGYTQQHRWYSRLLAHQIKAEIAGILPPAYRDMHLTAHACEA
ncbi:unnamed protein product [Aureobasidium vineae]|uniref:FAD/NAD(P)-binding domain-containing protein n=1 Tax=Aureobasidium vineae TaxID=2773715 RepID=A0A9N8J9H7_9PEZI|nr:unnamed protein product [Aureobasidium vineae]